MWGEPVGYRAVTKAPILMLAPRSGVGLTLDLREYFPALRGAGRYRIMWRPYGGGLSSDPVSLTIAPLKRAEITTDLGAMAVQLFYEDAPMHVDNFVELAESNFYDGLSFHRIEPGYLLQGGCPRGDGTGIRLDGKRVAAEFNGQRLRKGTLAMALLDDDPDSASCQFFICNTRQKEWDGRYTVFGQLVGESSYETLDRIMASEVDGTGRPVKPLLIRSIGIVEAQPDQLP